MSVATQRTICQLANCGHLHSFAINAVAYSNSPYAVNYFPNFAMNPVTFECIEFGNLGANKNHF